MSSSFEQANTQASIVRALAAANSHDIESIASILCCKRRASSSSIHEPCLSLNSIADQESIFKHETVLPHLIVCPSVYDIPWRAAVAAIRHHASSDEMDSSLDIDVTSFLHHCFSAWISKQEKTKEESRKSPGSSKRPRTGEIQTQSTPAKWLLRMAEAIFELTHEGNQKQLSKEQNDTDTKAPERLQDLLSILSSILHLTHTFDNTLTREILDRIFIRRSIRPNCVHLLLLHVASHDIFSKLLRSADWRGLQIVLQKDAALSTLDSFSDFEMADIVCCILHTGADASESKTAAALKVFRRWIDVFLLTLKACRGNMFVNETLLRTFTTLKSDPFKCWRDELLRVDRNNDAQAVHALILLAQTIGGRYEASEWRVSAFWDKVLFTAHWDSNAIEPGCIAYISKGYFEGSPNFGGLGRIVYESIFSSNGVINENNTRFWVRSTVDALLVEKDTLKLLPAATVIATILQECGSLCPEVFDKLIEYGAESTAVADALMTAVALLRNSTSMPAFLTSGDKLTRLLSLPVSLEVLDRFSAKAARANTIEADAVLQTEMRIFLFVQDQLNTIFIVKRDVDDDGHHPSVQAKRCLILLTKLFESRDWVQTQKARDLLCLVVVDNNPPIPLNTRAWLYEYLHERVRGGIISGKCCNLYCRMCLLRVLSILNDDDEEFCIDLAFRRLNDSLIQSQDDFSGLFRLLLGLLRSAEPKCFKVLRCVVAQNLSKSTRKDFLIQKVVKKSLFYKPLVVCLSLISGHPFAGKLMLRKTKSKIRQDELGVNSAPLPCPSGMQAHPSNFIGYVGSCQVSSEEFKFHALLELFLGEQYSAIEPASFSTCTTEELDHYLVAVAYWLTNQLSGLHPWLSHPRTATLMSMSTSCFCWLLLSSFNRIWQDKRRNDKVDIIVRATTLYCEICTCPAVQSQMPLKSSESLYHIPLLWNVYNLIGEEKKARLLLTFLEQNAVGTTSFRLEKDETTDDSIRRLRSGVLKLLRSRLKFMLNEPSAFKAQTLDRNDAMVCIQKITKRLSKNLVAVQEGQSGGLSHDLFENFLACLEVSLEILDIEAQSGYRSLTNDVASFCASQLKVVLKKFPLQRPGSLKKVLITWLWSTTKLGRSLFLAKSRVAKDNAELILTGQDDNAMAQCFVELHEVAAMRHKSIGHLPESLSQGAVCDRRFSHSRIFTFSNEKMWEGAFAAILQIAKNHWNESKKRIVLMNSDVFATTEDIESFFCARSDQLRVCLDGIVKSVCSSGSALVVLHLPYSVKTDVSHACDAFLSCLLQALTLLSEGTRKILDTQCFEAAASCIHAWAFLSGEDLPSALLRWQTAEKDLLSSTPPPNTDSLHRRLQKIATKVCDLKKALGRLISRDDEAQLIDRMDELVRCKDGGKERQVSLSELMIQKHKLLRKVTNSLGVKGIQQKKGKRKRANRETSSHNSIVGKWLEIERNDGHKITKDEDFDDLNDFLMEG